MGRQTPCRLGLSYDWAYQMPDQIFISTLLLFCLVAVYHMMIKTD